MKAPQPVAHLSTGKAKVEQVARNRRVQIVDGKVGKMRGSASKAVGKAGMDEPEPVIG